MPRSEKQDISREQIRVDSFVKSFSNLTLVQVLQDTSQPSKKLCQECRAFMDLVEFLLVHRHFYSS